jgi:hypothetical protein
VGTPALAAEAIPPWIVSNPGASMVFE